MTQDQALHRLRQLDARAQMLHMSFDLGNSLTEFTQMKFEAAGIVASYLGSDHYLVTALSDLKVSPTRFVVSGLGAESVSDEFIGLVRASINLVGLTFGRAAPKPPICDPDLWDHVEELVKIEAWAKIPATVVTFVEDWFRKRGGDPRTNNGLKLVGKGLFTRVLTEQPLGGEESEHEGWRFLGMGLAQAIGNLHRHNIEKRPDAEQLAWSVIGLGSLLIAEMKFTRPDPS